MYICGLRPHVAHHAHGDLKKNPIFFNFFVQPERIIITRKYEGFRYKLNLTPPPPEGYVGRLFQLLGAPGVF